MEEKVLALKEISENQKTKISSLREERNDLLDKVDKFELDQKQDSDLILRMTSETRSLKREVRDLRLVLEEKEELFSRKVEKENEIELLEMKCKDLVDEIITKDIKISNLEESIIGEKIAEKSLEFELNIGKNFGESNASKVEVLERELKRIKAKESNDKKERKVFYDQMDTLAKDRKDMLEKLKSKIKDVNRRTLPNCWHGKYCTRLFCKFNHRHVFTKVNIHSTKVHDNPNQSKGKEYLCDECGNILESHHELEN